MGPKLLLRISAVLMFIHAGLHALGHMQWKTITSPAYGEVVKQMTVPKFPYMGAVHSIGDYYDGYAYFITIVLILIGALLWALSDIAIKYPPVGLKLLIPVTVFIILSFFVTIIFFFPFAAAFSGVSSFLCAWAIVKLHDGHLAEVAGTVK